MKYLNKYKNIIFNVTLIVTAFIIAIKGYLAIDYDAGISYFDYYVGHIGGFILIIIFALLYLFIELFKKKKLSSLYFVYYLFLVVFSFIGWSKLNSKEYLAFILLILPVIILFSVTSENKDWWYLSKTSLTLDKVKQKLFNNFIVRATETHWVFFNKFKIKITRKRRENIIGYFFISLWLIGLLIFMLYPIVYSFYLSFTSSYYRASKGVVSSFVGLENYLNIIRNQTLMPKFSNYFLKMILAVPLIIIFALIIAMLINQPLKGKGIWRTIFFLPVIISSGPILEELSTQSATTLPSLENSQAISFIVENLGRWISDPLVMLMNSLLLVLWYAGVPILIFLAGLQKNDPAIYEASSIDGASPWERFWKITLPSIKPLITVAIIYVVVAMSLYIEPGSVLLDARAHMLGDDTWSYGYGYAAAISWIYFLLMLVIMGLYIVIMTIKRKEVKRWGK